MRRIESGDEHAPMGASASHPYRNGPGFSGLPGHKLIPDCHYESAIGSFGDERIIFSTDYPHGDSKYPHAVDSFDKLPLSDDSKAKIVSSNWSALYDIPLVKRL